MISFIGAGKVGTALGVYFKQKGCDIAGYYSRTYQHAIDASNLTNSKAFSNIQDLLMESSMVWITVTDDAIEKIAYEIARLDIPKHVKAFIHTSGVHSAKTLNKIEKRGFETFSAHPLMAFASAEESISQLNSVYFALESNENEYTELYLNGFFDQIGNKTLTIESDKKELYHCAASFLSNYMVILFNLSYEMFAETGMSKEDIKEATAPLLQSTLKNINENKKMSDALTGAIKRGDTTTVIKHLEALEKYMPSKTTLYKELGKETMEMLQDYKLKEILS